MIRITSQSATNQYDENGKEITTWDDKKCAWIVNKEFEREEIDWWGNNNDFPAGQTLAQFVANNPDWDKMPDIQVIWIWTKEEYWKAFKSNIDTAVISAKRTWGYLDYTEEQAIQELGRYADFHKFAGTVQVQYNNKLIFNGKLG